jgi:hypothetical protein
MTGFVPIMWSVWGGLVVILMAIFLYRSTLTRNEEDQIFLDDSFNHMKAEQTAIIARANKVTPILRVAGGLVGAMSLVLIGYYVWDVLNQFK